jgi:DNA-binding transcriptional MocR family regulator
MTNWLPNLEGRSGPLYLRLADRIEDDISAGVLLEGAKLPPQRDLAYDMGVTIGTVGRAYALARERGLVSGEVGRGTYVLRRRASAEPAPAPSDEARREDARWVAPVAAKIRLDSTAAPDVGQTDIIERLVAAVLREHGQEAISYIRNWPTSWREAGSRFLAGSSWRPDPATIAPTLGGHAGLLALISSVTMPGDKVAFEQLTFASIARSTSLIGRRPVAIETDSGTITPEGFERLCAQQHPKAVFLMPTIHNPTLTIISEADRHEIVAIARRYNVWLIEDNIYGQLVEDGPPLLVTLAPERTFHVGSLSKSVSAGVRGGWVACPANFATRLITSHRMITGGMPFLLADLAARLVLSGHAAAILAKVRAEIAAREAIARRLLDGFEFTSNPHTPFLWIKLPDPWLSANFKKACETEGVLVDDEDEFMAGRSARAFHRARVSLSVPKGQVELEQGLAVLRRLLESRGFGHDSYG